MSNVTVKASVKRRPMTKRNYEMKVCNTARFTFKFLEERLSVLVWDIVDDEIKPDEEKKCQLDFLSGQQIKDKLKFGDKFELLLADVIVADGIVEEIAVD